MIKKKEIFTTKNGQEHNSLEDAKQHVAENIQQVLYGFLVGILNREDLCVNRTSQVLEIVEYIAPSYLNASALVKQLVSAFENVDENI